MNVTARISVTGEDLEEVKKINGSLQDVATLIKDKKVSADDMISLISTVKRKPSIVKTALKYIL